ncbi:hypothetical protein LY78DRAFT_733810 [Colletotrichum sublineola]|uniref:BTB domain-containing protein n=1 Tax=Colletotrichum sublineola TaxID=1173701 RepID=A0A066XDI0_COLSU|nr:hypothetical protein LY78DRAFT_733810 [Colletotrichum sublineola]KDN64085.1 hypothetical protein CSUB01_05103 [Colletotrichum sublineola]
MSLKRKRTMEDILKSRAIKFIIGSEKAEFTVHSSCIVALSQTLHPLATSSGSGETEKIVTWGDVETSTFVNLMEYAYSGDYNVPQLTKKGNTRQAAAQGTAAGPGMVKKEPESEHASSPARVNTGQQQKNTDEDEETISLHAWMLDVSENGASSEKSSAQYKFCLQHFSPDTTASDGVINESSFATEAWLKDMQQQDCTGYQAVFDAHMGLYILADKYGITDLKDLCLRRIRLTLIYATGTDAMADAFFHTIRIVYGKTPPGDSLRSLLVKYFITDMEWMMREENGIASLLRSVPDFAADLLLEIPYDYWVEIKNGRQS